MEINKKDLENILKEAFWTTYELRNKGSFKDSNPRRSSKFVYEVSKRIHEKWYQDYTRNVIKVDDNGEKKPGEWMYDMCITEQKTIKDERYGDKGIEPINTKVLFAMESEFGTGIKDFAVDFGKLICSGADTMLYIQGLNQATGKGRSEFIENRISLVRKQLSHLISGNVFIGFCTSPGKKKDQSLWDKFSLEELLRGLLSGKCKNEHHYYFVIL